MVFRNINDYAASLAANNRRPVTATAGIGTNAEQGNNYTVDLGGQTSIGKTSTGGFTGMVQNAANINTGSSGGAVAGGGSTAQVGGSGYGIGSSTVNTGAMSGVREGLGGSGGFGNNALGGIVNDAGESAGAGIVKSGGFDLGLITDAADAKAAAEGLGTVDDPNVPPLPEPEPPGPSGGSGVPPGVDPPDGVSVTDPITGFAEWDGIGQNAQQKSMDELAQEYAAYQSGMRDNYFRDDTLGEMNKWQNIDAQQYAEDISAREAEILDATYKRMMGNQMRNMQAGMGARNMGMGGAASAMAGDIAASAALDRANAGIGIRQGARGEALGMKQGAMSMFGQEAGDIFSGFQNQQRIDVERQAAENLNALIEAQLAAAFGQEPVSVSQSDGDGGIVGAAANAAANATDSAAHALSGGGAPDQVGTPYYSQQTAEPLGASEADARIQQTGATKQSEDDNYEYYSYEQDGQVYWFSKPKPQIEGLAQQQARSTQQSRNGGVSRG